MRLAVIAATTALAACGAFYHVDPETPAGDAAVTPDGPVDGAPAVDGAPDAPSAQCIVPPLGAAADITGSAANNPIYFATGGSASMWLSDPGVYEAPAGSGALPAGTLVFPSSSMPKVTAPRLAPDGDHMFALQMPAPAVVEATRSGSGVWGAPVALTLPPTVVGNPSTPTSDLLDFVVDVGMGSFTEVTSTDHVHWTAVTTLGTAELGTMNSHDPSLSPDGRRVVFVGDGPAGMGAIYYADRIGGAFGAARLLFGAPGGGIATPFLDGCAALYYSQKGKLYRVDPAP